MLQGVGSIISPTTDASLTGVDNVSTTPGGLRGGSVMCDFGLRKHDCIFSHLKKDLCQKY